MNGLVRHVDRAIIAFTYQTPLSLATKKNTSQAYLVVYIHVHSSQMKVPSSKYVFLYARKVPLAAFSSSSFLSGVHHEAREFFHIAEDHHSFYSPGIMPEII